MSEVNNAAPAAPEAASPAAPATPENNTVELEGDESAEGAEAQPEAAITKKEREKLIKKFKLKVDGEEMDTEIDLNDEEAIRKELQLAKASQKRMKESSEIRKAAEEFLDVLKKDPRKIMKELGINEKELAQLIMNEELAEMEKTPEQKEIEQLKKQLETRMEKEKRDEEERKKSDFERIRTEAEQKIESDISSALETGGLAKTPYTVKKMAEMMYIALQNDIDLKPSDVVPLVRKQMEADLKEFFSATNDDQLEEFLKDQMPRLRKRNVAKAKQVDPVKNIKEATGPAGEKKEEVKKITISDFLKSKR